MKTKENKRKIAEQISFFTRGLSDYAGTIGIGIGFTPKSIGNPFRRLKKKLKENIRPYNLKIQNQPESADYMVILFSEFDNDDGYDCLGYKCYTRSIKGKFPDVTSIGYCGVCGDVNTIRFTPKNSKIVFLGSVNK